MELGLVVKAVQRELERMANEAMRPLGITGAQADALAVIGQAGPVSLKELGELLIAESGHPSRLVDRLVDAGLVAREAAADDRRRIVLTLTPAGRRLEKKVLSARQRVLEAGRTLLQGKDIGAALALADVLLAGSASGAIIERRRALDARRTNR